MPMTPLISFQCLEDRAHDPWVGFPPKGHGGGGHPAANIGLLLGQFPWPDKAAQRMTDAFGMVTASGPGEVFPPEA